MENKKKNDRLSRVEARLRKSKNKKYEPAIGGRCTFLSQRHKIVKTSFPLHLLLLSLSIHRIQTKRASKISFVFGEYPFPKKEPLAHPPGPLLSISLGDPLPKPPLTQRSKNSRRLRKQTYHRWWIDRSHVTCKTNKSRIITHHRHHLSPRGHIRRSKHTRLRKFLFSLIVLYTAIGTGTLCKKKRRKKRVTRAKRPTSGLTTHVPTLTRIY